MANKRRKQEAAAKAQVSAAKNIGFDTWPGLYGLSGLTYENQDLSRSKSGAALSYQTVIAVRRAVDLIANALLSMDWAILRNPGYDRADDEIVASSEDVKPRHALQWAFQRHRRAYGLNPLRVIAADYQLYGEVYLQKLSSPVSGGARSVKRLNPLGVTYTKVNGEIVRFSYAWDGESAYSLSPDEVAYWHSLHPADDERGLGVVASALDQVNIKRNLQRYLRAYFANNARPDVIVSPEGENTLSMPETEALRRILAANHKGTDNAGGALVLSRAMKALELSPPDMTAQYEIDESITRQIAMAFGVPMSMMGDSSASSYKDGDDVMYGFFRTTIIPFAADVQEYINYQIMPFFDPSGNTRFEFDLSGFERVGETDLAQVQLAETLYRSGLATLNEARQHAGLDKVDGVEDAYMFDGVPIPVAEMPNLWKYKLLVAPSVYNSQLVTGEPLPQPVDPTQVVPTGDPEAPEGAPLDDEEPPPDGNPPTGGGLPVPQEQKAARYDHIDFRPTDGMVEEAKRGLAWRDEFGRGGTAVGVARARDIANRRNLSPETVRRMKAYFDRHQSDKQAEGFSPGEDGFPSAGRVAWALWSGDAGYSWAKARVEQMNAADANNRKQRALADLAATFGIWGEGDFDDSVFPPACDCGHDHDHDHGFEADDSPEPTVIIWTRQAALNELKAWARRVKDGKAKKRFEPRYLDGIHGETLQTALETDGEEGFWRAYADVKAALQVDRLALLEDGAGDAFKTFAGTERTFRRQFDDALDAVVTGVQSNAASRQQLMAIIERWATQAYLDGMADGGIENPSLDDEDKEILTTWFGQQASYVSNFVAIAEGLSEAQQANKAREWFNGSIRPMYEKGLEKAAKQRPFFFFGSIGTNYKWTLGNAEHCATCQYLDGMIQPMAAWYAAGLLPGSNKLICTRYCKCRLIRTQEPANGDIVGAPIKA